MHAIPGKIHCAAVLLALMPIGAWDPRCQAQHPAGTKQPLTPEAALNLRRISSPRFSPDGRRVVFAVTEPPRGDAEKTHLWLLDTKSHDVRWFTSSAKSETAPRWSPDGRRLAFLSNRADFQQIYVLPVDGGESSPLTEGKRNINSFEWSPNGRLIAFLAPEPKTEAEEKKEKDKDDARVVDREEKRTRLWVMDVESRAIRQLTSGPWSLSEFQWMPQGDRFLVSATDHPESDQHTHRIFLVDLADGKRKEIAAPRGPFGTLRVSPDGKWLSYLAAREDGPSPHDLYLCPVSGGRARNLTGASLDRPIAAYLWRPDDTVLALAQTGFRTTLFLITTEGRATPLEGVPIRVTAMDQSSAGELALICQSATEPAEIWLKDATGTAQRISHLNEQWSRYALAQPELIRYKSFDGLEVEGALLKPPGQDDSSKLPLVVLIHGGPTAAWTESIEPWGQLLAARGYAVFYPNIRGSSGYGHRFLELNRGDWGGGDFKDVMAGVDFLIARGIANPDRLGIGGWSYGGYMAGWAITQTRRFKAAVVGAGLANLASEYGTERGPAYDEWFYGVPYEKMQGFLKSSPITHIQNARTPTLILQGTEDVTDPIGQSQELYRGLKRYGVETEFILYPREGHGFREERHLLDRLNRILSWFERHLETAAPIDPQVERTRPDMDTSGSAQRSSPSEATFASRRRKQPRLGMGSGSSLIGAVRFRSRALPLLAQRLIDL